MPVIEQQAIVASDCSRMYQLVNTIEDYPQFVPYCYDAKVLQHLQNNDLHAYMAFRGYGAQARLVTHNHLRSNHSIHMQLVEGPLSSLDGVWRFVALGEQQCSIALSLRFEFKRTAPFDWLFQRLLQHLMHAQLHAFCRRAEEVERSLRKVTNGS